MIYNLNKKSYYNQLKTVLVQILLLFWNKVVLNHATKQGFFEDANSIVIVNSN